MTTKKRISYRYTPTGQRSLLVDPDGGRFTYSYDNVRRLTRVLNPQGQRTTFGYDNASRRTLKKLANGSRTSFTYDLANRITSVAQLKSDASPQAQYQYKYDKAGNRLAMAESGHTTARTTWSYDAAYQLTGEHRTGANAFRNTFTYAQLNPAGTVDPSGTTVHVFAWAGAGAQAGINPVMNQLYRPLVIGPDAQWHHNWQNAITGNDRENDVDAIHAAATRIEGYDLLCRPCYPRIILLGYSWGGNTVFDVVNELAERDPKVIIDAIVTIDPVIGAWGFSDQFTINQDALPTVCFWKNFYQTTDWASLAVSRVRGDTIQPAQNELVNDLLGNKMVGTF